MGFWLAGGLYGLGGRGREQDSTCERYRDVDLRVLTCEASCSFWPFGMSSKSIVCWHLPS